MLSLADWNLLLAVYHTMIGLFTAMWRVMSFHIHAGVQHGHYHYYSDDYTYPNCLLPPPALLL